MTAIDRTAYPRLAIQLSKKEVEAFYKPSSAEITFVSEQGRGAVPRLSRLVLLKTFQHLGYFPDLDDVPEAIVQYLRKVLQLQINVGLATVKGTSLYRHHAAIRAYLEIKPYNDASEQLVETTMQQAALTMHNPADLINAAIETLIAQRFELPAFSRLDRLAQRIRTSTHEAWYQEVFEKLSETDLKTLESLLLLQGNQTRTAFIQMKETPGRPRLKEMQRLKERLRYLSSLANTEELLLDIPPARLIHFADEARSLENHHLLQMRPNHAYTLLLCLLHHAKMQTRDHLVEVFINRIQHIHQHAKDDLDAFNEQARQNREKLIELFAEIALKVQRISNDAELGTELRALLEAAGGAEYLYKQAQALILYHDDNTLPFLWSHYAKHRKAVWDLIILLDLRSTSEDQELMEALDFLRQNLDAERLKAEVSLSFASQRWLRFVVERDEQGQSWFNRRAFELCVLSYLAQDLKSGDIAVLGSEDHADYREQMLSWEEALPRLDDYCASIGIPSTAEGLFQLLYTTLKEIAERVDQRFPEDGQLSLNKRGEIILKRIRAYPQPAGSAQLKRAIQEQMPERNLLDILAFVEHWVHYTRHFGPLSGSDSKLSDPLARYIMTVFSYGCNLGPA